MAFSTDVSDEVVEAFNEFVAANGYIKRRVTEAALMLIQWIPDAVRARLIAGDYASVKAWLGLRDPERTEALWKRLAEAFEGPLGEDGKPEPSAAPCAPEPQAPCKAPTATSRRQK